MHAYERGRLDLPFVGHCTFGKRPPCLDWDALDADVAVLGVPYDMGTQYRAGRPLRPARRSARPRPCSPSAMAAPTTTRTTWSTWPRTRSGSSMWATPTSCIPTPPPATATPRRRCARSSSAAPCRWSLGGDHAVNIPCVRAFSGQPPIHLIQIDAHLDFVDVRHGVREGHGNPMRRAAEQAHVTGLTQLGIRNVSSTAREGYEDARRRGSQIRSVRQCRRLGTEGVLELIPAGARYYVTIDIDAFDPSIAPGTGTPSHGGFLYWEVMELLQGIARRGDVVGIDLVEVAPPYDPSGITSILAAQVLLNFLGYIFHEREHR